MSNSEGLLHALWYDSAETSDRIYFTRQNDPGRGRGIIVDDNPERMNNMPSGAVGLDNRVYVSWRGESIFGGQIFLTTGNFQYSRWEFSESRLISDGQKLFYSEPDCQPYDDGTVGIVWISSALDGGDGSVYYRRLVP